MLEGFMLHFTEKFKAYLSKWNINYTCVNNVYSYNYELENKLKVLAKHTVDEQNFTITFSFNFDSLYCPRNKKNEILNLCNKWNSNEPDLYAFLCPKSNTLKLIAKVIFFDKTFPTQAIDTIDLYHKIIYQFYKQVLDSKLFDNECTPEIFQSNPEKAVIKEKTTTKDLVFNMASNDISFLGYSFVQPPLAANIKKK